MGLSFQSFSRYLFTLKDPQFFDQLFYIQVWFKVKPSDAGLVLIGPVFGQIMGMIFAGFVLNKFKPHARYVTAWGFLGSCFLCLGLFGISFTGCDRSRWILRGKIHHGIWTGWNKHILSIDHESHCLQDCNCDPYSFNPICFEEFNLNYYSPCAAGCLHSSIKNGQVTYQVSTELFSNESIKLILTFECHSRIVAAYRKWLMGHWFWFTLIELHHFL